jgi:protein-S-isoprenylcysteine O-methyltransferase Ste14
MASVPRNIVATVLFTLFGGPGILLVILPWAMTRFKIVADAPADFFAIGCVLIALGLVPLLDSIVRFVVVGRGALVPAVPTEHLVVSGLYRYMRNPMYVGIMLALGGEALLFWSTGVTIELAAVAVGFHLFVRFYEEPKLTRTFGDEYRRYQRHVKRWIPRRSPWSP